MNSSSKEPSGEGPAHSSGSDAAGLGQTPKPGQFFRSAWVSYLVLAILGVLWVGHHFEAIPLALFIAKDTWWFDLLWGLGAGLALLAAWALGRRLIPDMRHVEEEIHRLMGPLEGSDAVTLAIISGFSEELFFRGAMQASWGWGWALGIFAALHTGPGRSFRYWTAFALIAGAIFAWLTLHTGNLLAAISAHILVNGVNLYRLSTRQPLPLEASLEVPLDTQYPH